MKIFLLPFYLQPVESHMRECDRAEWVVVAPTAIKNGETKHNENIFNLLQLKFCECCEAKTMHVSVLQCIPPHVNICKEL